jgi:hypothetical protein
MTDLIADPCNRPVLGRDTEKLGIREHGILRDHVDGAYHRALVVSRSGWDVFWFEQCHDTRPKRNGLEKAHVSTIGRQVVVNVGILVTIWRDKRS